MSFVHTYLKCLVCVHKHSSCLSLALELLDPDSGGLHPDSRQLVFILTVVSSLTIDHPDCSQTALSKKCSFDHQRLSLCMCKYVSICKIVVCLGEIMY